MKQEIPTPTSIRKAYVEEYLKRRPDAEEFAWFTESELADFIRKHESPNFESIYTQLDHNYYDRVRHDMAIDWQMRTEFLQTIFFAEGIRTFEFLFVAYASPPLIDTDRLVTALASCFAEPSSRKHIFSALEQRMKNGDTLLDGKFDRWEGEGWIYSIILLEKMVVFLFNIVHDEELFWWFTHGNLTEFFCSLQALTV